MIEHYGYARDAVETITTALNGIPTHITSTVDIITNQITHWFDVEHSTGTGGGGGGGAGSTTVIQMKMAADHGRLGDYGRDMRTGGKPIQIEQPSGGKPIQIEQPSGGKPFQVALPQTVFEGVTSELDQGFYEQQNVLYDIRDIANKGFNALGISQAGIIMAISGAIGSRTGIGVIDIRSGGKPIQIEQPSGGKPIQAPDYTRTTSEISLTQRTVRDLASALKYEIAALL